MDFEDLLDEVEGVMQGTAISSSSSRKPSYSSMASTTTTAKTTSDRPSYSKTSNTSRNDIDDLLDMIGDESEPAPIHPRAMSSTELTKSTSLSLSSPFRKDEFQAGGKKK